MLMAHEAEIIIPGSFVVLQGNAGDGMSNTIDEVPIEDDEDDFDNAAFNSSSRAPYGHTTELDDIDEDEADDDNENNNNIPEVSVDDADEGEFQHVEMEDDQKMAASPSGSVDHDMQNSSRGNPPSSNPTTATTNTATRMVGLGQLASQRAATPTVALNRWTNAQSSTRTETASTPSAASDDSFIVVTGQEQQSSSPRLATEQDHAGVSHSISSDGRRQTKALKTSSSTETSSRTQQSQRSRDSRTDNELSLSSAEAIERWQIECRDREVRQRLEWKQANVEQQQQLLQQDYQMLESPTAESSIASMLSIFGGSGSRTTDRAEAAAAARSGARYGEHHLYDGEEWWHSEGQVAVFQDVPRTELLQSAEAGQESTMPSHRTVVRNVIGALGPGTTIVANELMYLDSHTLERLDVAPTTSTHGSVHNIYPRGRPGWIQLLKFEYQPSENNDNVAEPPNRMAFCVLSLDGYPLLSPGLPSLYVDPHVWVWRVTCPAGAYVREGLDLNTRHIDTIPFGSLVRVTRKSVNSMGLSRLRVQAVVDDTTISAQKFSLSKKLPSTQSQSRVVDGWCSEFLNPLSGQRGIVASPLPFPVPALYRVTLAEGAVIRRTVELSSAQIGVAPMGTVVKVVRRAFSDHPMENCIERLQLAGNGGWISVRLNRPPPENDMVVEFVGIDGTFEPNYPGRFHIQAARTVRLEHATNNPTSGPSAGIAPSDGGRVASASGNAGEVSSIDDSHSQSNSSGANSVDGRVAPTIRRTAPNSSRTSRGTSSPYPGAAGGGSGENYKCLICLTEERNATIVHGETGHVACCLVCARILKARGDKCPVCRLHIDLVIQQFWA